MASAVAKRRDRRASRSASWSVMHSDEELARILQMQEEKDYQDHLAAKEKQCKNDHKLARFLSEHDGHQEIEIDVDASQGGRRPANTRSMLQSHSAGALVGTSSQNTTLVSLTDSDADFSDCFEDPTFNELASVLEVARNEADHLAERQDAADMLARDGEIAAALQNDEQLNGILENELELSGSTGEVGNASLNPIVVSPSDLSGPVSEPMEFGAAFVDIDDDGDWTSENEAQFSPGTSPTNSSLLTSVNMAWNVVGSAVNWVSELFSGVPSLPPESGVGDRARTRRAGDAEEDDDDDDEEEDCCDDGWEDEDSDDLDDFDDDEDDDEDDAFDLMESDVDDSDDDNVEMAVGFGGHPVGRGLVQEEINVLPTRTYQTRPTQTASTTTVGAADAGANEHQCQNECQVCLSSFADGEVLRTLPCCHQFHSECIDVWLQRNAICPVCRVRIRDEIGCR